MSTTIERERVGQRLARGLGSLPPAFWGLILVCAVAAATQPQFLSLPFLMILLRQAAPLGIVALGQTFVVVNRSLDLSVGATIAFVNILVSDRMWRDVPVVWTVLAALGTGAAIGAINGLLVTRLRASAVVVTLGTASILTGAGLLFSGGAPGNAMDELIKWVGRGRVGNVPVAGFVWLAVAVASTIALRRLAIGRYVYAVGDNATAATYAGVRTDSTLMFSHVVCGTLAATGGLVLSGLVGVGSLNLGSDYVLSSIAATVLGGAVFGGGRGSAFGTVLGTMLLVMVLNLLTVFGIDEPGKLIVQGAVIAVAAAVYQARARAN